MEAFTRMALQECEIPLKGFQRLETKNLPKDKVWTKERIVQEIKNDAAYLISAEEHAQSLRLMP